MTRPAATLPADQAGKRPLLEPVATAPAVVIPSEPGLYAGLRYEEYSQIPAVNHSTLIRFRKTPAHVRHALLHGGPDDEASEALERGAAVHAAVLEPDRFRREYVRGLVDKPDRRTKDGKRRWSEFLDVAGGREILEPAMWDQVAAMREAVFACSTARALLTAPGPHELVAVWRDVGTGELCRARTDAVKSFMGWTWIIDLKSTASDASARPFMRSVVRYGYAEQGAWYLDGLDALKPARRRFVWIVVESKPPHGVAIYEPDDATVEAGRQAHRRHLAAFAECKRSGNWPGYPDGVVPLELPRWARHEISGEETAAA